MRQLNPKKAIHRKNLSNVVLTIYKFFKNTFQNDEQL